MSVGTQRYVRRYVDQALTSHDDLDDAATWLAVFVANDAAGSATGRPRATVLEAYRQVRAMADAAAVKETIR